MPLIIGCGSAVHKDSKFKNDKGGAQPGRMIERDGAAIVIKIVLSPGTRASDLELEVGHCSRAQKSTRQKTMLFGRGKAAH